MKTSSGAVSRPDFAGFVESRSRALLRLAYVLTGQREAAEDLVQDTLVDVFRHWPRVNRARHRDAYVRRMLMNRYLTSARRRHWDERPLDGSQADRGSAAGTVSYEDHDVVWRALGELSPRQQAVLVLRYYEDLDDKQIGAILGCRPASVRSLVSRALASLRANPNLKIHKGAETPAEDQ